MCLKLRLFPAYSSITKIILAQTSISLLKTSQPMFNLHKDVKLKKVSLSETEHISRVCALC